MSEPNPMVTALIKAQQGFTPLLKGKTANVGKYSYKYIDLSSVLEAVMPSLHTNGFALTQPVGMSPLGEPTVMTTLLHESGESIKSEYPVRVADPTDPQKVGGGVTFARRYSLISLLGLATEDDDGNHARTPRPEPERVPVQAPEPVLFMTGPDTEAWTADVKQAVELKGAEHKAALNDLWLRSAQDRNLEKIEVMLEHLDFDDANKIASTAETKGLLSSRAIEIMTKRSNDREIEQAQSVPA